MKVLEKVEKRYKVVIRGRTKVQVFGVGEVGINGVRPTVLKPYGKDDRQTTDFEKGVINRDTAVRYDLEDNRIRCVITQNGYY